MSGTLFKVFDSSAAGGLTLQNCPKFYCMVVVANCSGMGATNFTFKAPTDLRKMTTSFGGLNMTMLSSIMNLSIYKIKYHVIYYFFYFFQRKNAFCK